MTTLDVLRGARQLISDRRRWTVGANARNAVGEKVGVTHPGAVAWCAQGAMKRTCLAAADPFAARGAWAALAAEALPRTIPGINDGVGYAAALGLFDRAIEKLETEQLEAIPVAEPSSELIPV